MAVILEARALEFAYTPGRPVLQGISFALDKGELAFLLGPNGGGKSTLIECLCGLKKPARGKVLLGGRPVHELPLRARARLLSYVPQVHEPPFAYSVWQVVLMGRAPYLSLLGRPGREDHAAACAALEAVGLGEASDRPYTTLSGGERRLVLIARSLAQEAEFMLLDEPDAHLDPAHQHLVLSVLKELAREGKGVLASSHSPNNALLYGDRSLLLAEGKALALGRPREVLTPGLLTAAYGIPFRLVQGPDGEAALLPVVPQSERSAESPATESESGAGRESSRSSWAKASTAAKGA